MPKLSTGVQVDTKCFMAEHILRSLNMGKSMGWAQLTAGRVSHLQQSITYTCAVLNNPPLGIHLTATGWCRITPDLLCMFLVLLISLLILKFLQTFQNARCEHEKQLPLHTPYRKATSSSPSQECYNHWQLAPGFTHKPELLKKHVPDIGSLFIPTALQLVQHLVVRMGMCTPTYRQGCCTQPRVETDRRTHPVFSFHSHLCSSGAT